jgi:hypothetical protein
MHLTLFVSFFPSPNSKLSLARSLPQDPIGRHRSFLVRVAKKKLIGKNYIKKKKKKKSPLN